MVKSNMIQLEAILKQNINNDMQLRWKFKYSDMRKNYDIDRIKLLIKENEYWRQDGQYYLKYNLVFEPFVKWVLEYIFFNIMTESIDFASKFGSKIVSKILETVIFLTMQ